MKTKMIIYMWQKDGSDWYTTSRKLPPDMCWVTGYCLHLTEFYYCVEKLLFILLRIKTHWSGFRTFDFYEIKLKTYFLIIKATL